VEVGVVELLPLAVLLVTLTEGLAALAQIGSLLELPMPGVVAVVLTSLFIVVAPVLAAQVVAVLAGSLGMIIVAVHTNIIPETARQTGVAVVEAKPEGIPDLMALAVLVLLSSATLVQRKWLQAVQ